MVMKAGKCLFRIMRTPPKETRDIDDQQGVAAMYNSQLGMIVKCIWEAENA
jgi:hypothetical protein